MGEQLWFAFSHSPKPCIRSIMDFKARSLTFTSSEKNSLFSMTSKLLRIYSRNVLGYTARGHVWFIISLLHWFALTKVYASLGHGWRTSRAQRNSDRFYEIWPAPKERQTHHQLMGRQERDPSIIPNGSVFQSQVPWSSLNGSRQLSQTYKIVRLSIPDVIFNTFITKLTPTVRSDP